MSLQSLVTPGSVRNYYTMGLYKPPSFPEEIKYIYVINILSMYIIVCVCLLFCATLGCCH